MGLVADYNPRAAWFFACQYLTSSDAEWSEDLFMASDSQPWADGRLADVFDQNDINVSGDRLGEWAVFGNFAIKLYGGGGALSFMYWQEFLEFLLAIRLCWFGTGAISNIFELDESDFIQVWGVEVKERFHVLEFYTDPASTTWATAGTTRQPWVIRVNTANFTQAGLANADFTRRLTYLRQLGPTGCGGTVWRSSGSVRRALRNVSAWAGLLGHEIGHNVWRQVYGLLSGTGNWCDGTDFRTVIPALETNVGQPVWAPSDAVTVEPAPPSPFDVRIVQVADHEPPYRVGETPAIQQAVGGRVYLPQSCQFAGGGYLAPFQPMPSRHWLLVWLEEVVGGWLYGGVEGMIQSLYFRHGLCCDRVGTGPYVADCAAGRPPTPREC